MNNITVLKHSIYHFEKPIFLIENDTINCVAFGEDFMVVSLRNTTQKDNVIKLNIKGDVLWRIQPNPLEDFGYQGPGIGTDGVFYVGGLSYIFELDPNTGLVSNPVFTK